MVPLKGDDSKVRTTPTTPSVLNNRVSDFRLAMEQAQILAAIHQICGRSTEPAFLVNADDDIQLPKADMNDMSSSFWWRNTLERVPGCLGFGLLCFQNPTVWKILRIPMGFLDCFVPEIPQLSGTVVRVFVTYEHQTHHLNPFDFNGK